MVFEQANFTRSKVAAPLVFAGVDLQGPILAGFSAKFTLSFREVETLLSWRIYSDTGFENVLLNNQVNPGDDATAEILFGTHTESGTSPIRNYIEWVTDRITQTRQFFVQDLPFSESLYVNNQECQEGEAAIFMNKVDSQRVARDVSLSFNILPNLADEFFNIQEYSGEEPFNIEEEELPENTDSDDITSERAGNRWANTRRGWGGAKTAEVFLDGDLKIVESPIEDIHGFYWRGPEHGLHSVRVRIRAEKQSSDFIDINGTLRITQQGCK